MKALFYITTLLCCAGAAEAVEPVTVLGLPLGGKIKMPVPQCRTSRAKAQILCQSGPPLVTTSDARMISITMPGGDQRPKWAADDNFEAWVSRNGTLRSFEVRTYRSDAFVEILNSITGRFGQSQRESPAGSRIMTATWNRPDIHIELLCSGRSGCKTTFTSAEAQAEHERKLEAQRTKDAARSATP